MEHGGFVYLICDPYRNLYKIGVSKNEIDKRLNQLQTGNASELHITNYYKTDYPYRIETMLHNFLKPKNVLNEWYDLSLDDVLNFTNMCIQAEDIIDALKDNPHFAKDLK